MALNPAQPNSGGAAPAVSVLLPAWNDAPMLGRCLDSLLAIDHPSLEVIVCAGGTDGTLDAARRYAGDRVTVLEQLPNEGKQVALRRCFEQSSGDVIYLTDADCVVPADDFRAVIQPVLQGHFQAATGTSVPLPDQAGNALVRYQWGKDAAWNRVPRETALGALGRNSAVHREILAELRIFEAPVLSGTDYFMSQQLRRAEVPIAWTPGCVLSEYPATPRAYITMWRRWVKNVLVLGTRYRSYPEVASTLVGVGSAGLLVSLPVLGIAIDRRLLAPWVALLAWITSRRLKAHETAVQGGFVPPIPGAVLRVPAFVLLDAVGALLGLVAALVPSMRRGW